MNSDSLFFVASSDSISNLSQGCTNNIDLVGRTMWGMPLDIASFMVPAIVSIGIFIIGLIIDGLCKRCKKSHEEKNFRKTIYCWTKLLEEPNAIQVKSLRQLADSILNTVTLQPEAYAFNRSMVNKLNDVSAEKMITLFAINRKGSDADYRNAYNIVGQIAFLSEIEDDIHTKYSGYHNSCEKLMESWNEKWKQLMNHKKQLVGGGPQEVDIYRVICGCFNVLRKDHVSNKELFDDFINPLYDSLVEAKSENPSAKNGDLVFDDLFELKMIGMQWDAILKGYSKMFNDIADKIETSYNALRSSCLYFENKESS